jgi:hypothetical protein
MKKKGYPIQTPTKQRETIPRNPRKTTRTSIKKKFYK